MAQQLSTHIDPLEDPCSVPGTHVSWLTTACDFSSRTPSALSRLPLTALTCTCHHTDKIHACTLLKVKTFFKILSTILLFLCLETRIPKNDLKGGIVCFAHGFRGFSPTLRRTWSGGSHHGGQEAEKGDYGKRLGQDTAKGTPSLNFVPLKIAPLLGDQV